MSSTDQTDLGVPGIGPGALIGAGGTARVYRARQDALDRTVAVKILGPLDDAGRRRFDRERRAMGRLSAHRGIVTVYEAGVNSHGQSYVVMPLMEQGSLQDIVDRGLVDWPVAARMVSDVAATIADAHEMSILHRDLKPGNVLVDDQGNPQVADFGLAHIVDSATAHKSTQLSFTPGYVPPETLEGLPATAAGDVYSLGATLFALLAGRAPFVSESADGNILALALRVRDEAVPDLRPRGVPDALCSVLEASMDKDPAGRPSARELSDRLGAIASGDVSTGPSAVAIATVPDATRVIAPGPVQAGPPAGGPAPLPIVPVDGHGGGNGRIVAAIGGVAALVVAAIVGFVVIGGGDDPGPGPGTDVGADDGIAAGDDGSAGDVAPPADDVGTDDAGVDDGEVDDAGAADGESDAGPPTDDGGDGTDDTGGDGGDQAPDDGGVVTVDVTALDPMITTTWPVSIEPRFPLPTDDGLFVTDPDAGRLVRLDVVTGDEATVDVGDRPGGLALSEGLIWVPNRGDGTVTVVDAADMTVVATLDAGNGVNVAAGDGTQVYVPVTGEDSVAVFDAATLDRVATVEVGPAPFTPGFFDGFVWVPNRGDDTISIIDPTTFTVVDTVAVAAEPDRPEELFGRLWVVGQATGEVTIFDPGSFTPAATMQLGPELRPPVEAGGLVWIVGVTAERVWGIRPANATIAHTVPLPSGGQPRPLRAALGGVWVSLAGLDEVRVIDPESGQIVHTVRDVGAEPAFVAPIDDVIAVPATAEQSVAIIDPGGP